MPVGVLEAVKSAGEWGYLQDDQVNIGPCQMNGRGPDDIPMRLLLSKAWGGLSSYSSRMMPRQGLIDIQVPGDRKGLTYGHHISTSFRASNRFMIRSDLVQLLGTFTP